MYFMIGSPSTSGLRRDARHKQVEQAPPGSTSTRKNLYNFLMPPDVHAAIDSVYRSGWSRIVAALIRVSGDFDVAEESAQEAFAAALQEWPAAGIPDSPRAWIIQTPRH